MAVKPTATGRLLKAGIAVLIAGALLLLLGAVGAFYFWNNNEKHVKLIFIVSVTYTAKNSLRDSYCGEGDQNIHSKFILQKDFQDFISVYTGGAH